MTRVELLLEQLKDFLEIDKVEHVCGVNESLIFHKNGKCIELKAFGDDYGEGWFDID